MTGLVGLSGRQPPSSILALGKDTREPLETAIEPDDTQAMSPRMTSEEVEALKREMHTELHRHAATLRDSLLLILNRAEAVEKGYEKLHSNQKVLQKYMEDLTSIHQTMASDSHEKH
ncbi:putative bzip transcription factor protein [Fusarium austroafricanum]|uniref:Putative bzip transcription factor protein n=1 Tax=Fusarium austroafricanum TaxID=2364996 RepID=A0A8H4JPF4_9HYPO|nr:putative bzip transcription factor protein [Fusarium austroafricanum]